MIDYHLASAINKTFAEIMELRPLELPRTPKNVSVYQSTVQPFQPMKGFSGVFGGHVLAQVVVAGSMTTDIKQVCHSLHGYFLERGNPLIPFIFTVEKLRDGGRFANREIRVYQCDEDKLADFSYDKKDMIFFSLLSFKSAEKDSLCYNAPYPEKYARPDHEIITMEPANDFDAPVILDFAREFGIESQWHTIDCRKMDTTESNKEIPILSDRRIIHYFRSPFRLPNQINIHVALLLYISDRNSLFTLINIQDDPYLHIEKIASIDHQFVLHRLDAMVDDDYIMMETWSDAAGDGRGLYNGRMFDSKKRLIASFAQDGVVRVLKRPKSNL